MLKYKQIWHGIKPTRWLIKFNLTDRKSNKWIVGEFKRKHNHNLVTQFETQFLCSHRTIKDFNKA